MSTAMRNCRGAAEIVPQGPSDGLSTSRYRLAIARPSRPRRVSEIDAVGRIAQLVEQLTLNQRVAGSSPAAPTIGIEAKSPGNRGFLLVDPDVHVHRRLSETGVA